MTKDRNTENKLTAMAVKQLKEPGRYADGHGLYLQVTETGSRSWVFRYERGGANGKRGGEKMMGLGPVHTVTLIEARVAACAARKKLIMGDDPLTMKQAARIALRGKIDLTFAQCLERYVSAHDAIWRNDKHRRQWTSSLNTHAASIMDLDVAKIDTPHVLEVLNPIWVAKAETAKRVCGRIESVLDWAKARSYRVGENPARMKGHLDALLPKRKKVVKHHEALPYAQVPGLMADLRSLDDIGAKALEFTILTAARTGEVIGARWSEFDLDSGVWTVPGDRMKAGHEHRVPLSPRAIEILKSIQPSKEFVFNYRGKPISNMAMAKVIKGRANVTVHGTARASFKTWAMERTAFPREVIEKALAHAVGKVEGSYIRSDNLDKRRRLMNDWASYCVSPPREGSVVPMRAAR